MELKLIDRWESQTLAAFNSLCRQVGVAPDLYGLGESRYSLGSWRQWARSISVFMGAGQVIRQEWVFVICRTGEDEADFSQVAIKFVTSHWERMVSYKIRRSEMSHELVFIPEGSDPKPFLSLSTQAQARRVKAHWREKAFVIM